VGVARPFVVGITEQRRNPGVRRAVAVAGPLAGLGTSAAAVPADEDVRADVVVEAMTDGRVTVTGTVRAPWEGECRRCLRPVRGDLAVDVQEVFEPHPVPDAETYRLDGDHLDLEPMIRDAVLLALPLAPLCEEACEGPDPEGHPVGAADDADPDGGGDDTDPRWAALRELRFE
jgi:uncharacterized protein